MDIGYQSARRNLMVSFTLLSFYYIADLKFDESFSSIINFKIGNEDAALYFMWAAFAWFYYRFLTFKNQEPSLNQYQEEIITKNILAELEQNNLLRGTIDLDNEEFLNSMSRVFGEGQWLPLLTKNYDGGQFICTIQKNPHTGIHHIEMQTDVSSIDLNGKQNLKSIIYKLPHHNQILKKAKKDVFIKSPMIGTNFIPLVSPCILMIIACASVLYYN